MDVMSRTGVEPVGLSRESFTEFYRHEWRDVVGLGFVLTGDRATAEDLAQEAFTAASRQWDRVSEMDKPDTVFHLERAAFLVITGMVLVLDPETLPRV